MTLNDKQLNAVIANRPLMVIAAPGSGKTATVVERIKYNIEKKGIKPWRILALTFTNVAANEIKARSGYDIQSKTIHSWCYRQLSIEGLSSKVAHPKMFQNFLDAEPMPEDIDRNEVAESIQLVRLGLILLDDLTEEIRAVIKSLKNKYEYSLKKRGLIDFTDMLGIMHYKLKDGRYANKIYNMYDEVIVDEAQDLDKVQLEIIRHITNNYSNVVFVGDPDQSIYGFLGAMPDMGSTATEYSIPVMLLDKTYRFSQNLGDISTFIINNTQRSVKKEINCINQGTKVVLSEFNIDKIKDMGYKEEDIVILNRTNTSAFDIAEKLDVDVMRMPSLKIRKSIGYMMNMVNYATLRDPISLQKFLMEIKGFGPKTVEKIGAEATPGIIKKSFDVGIAKAFGISRKNLAKALEHVDNDLIELKDGYFVPGFTMFRHTPEYIRNVIDRFEGEKLEYVRDVMYNKQLMGTSSITVHAAKGMEFPVVYINSAGNDIRVSTRNYDEEMRISYVAITRAKEVVIINQDTDLYKNYILEYMMRTRSG